MKSTRWLGDSLRAFKRASKGFTLVEMLLVIAVISVMSALVISAVSNSAADTRTIVARQQQAVLQEALNAWVASASAGNLGLQAARSAYSSNGSSQAKLTLISGYLDSGTYSNFTTNAGGAIQSDAMSKIGKSLTFSTWTSNSYPRVEMQ